MSAIKDCLDGLLGHAHEMDKLVEQLSEIKTEANEFVAIEDLRDSINKTELLIHDVRKVFERTKDLGKDVT